MAHADYNCCLICDNKMDYNGFSSSTKEQVCTDCLSIMRDLGQIYLTQKELIKALKKMSYTKALIVLHLIGYEPCYYGNPVDKYLAKRNLITSKAKDGKWGKRLRKVSQNGGSKT